MTIYRSVLFVSVIFLSVSTSSWGGPSHSSIAGDSRKETDPYIRNQVKNTILKKAPELQKCYFSHLDKKPKQSEGNITIDWQINKKGRVKTPEIVQSAFQAPVFEKCLTDKISKWRFPPPEKATQKYVSHSFTFKKVK